MSAPTFENELRPSRTALAGSTENNSVGSEYDLTVRQQPERARVAGGKEKGTFSTSFCFLCESLRRA